MGTDISIKKMIDSRDNHLINIINNLDKWDGSIESGIKIIDDNETNIEKIKHIDIQLKKSSHTLEYNKADEDRLQTIIENQREMWRKLKGEQDSLLGKIKRLNKRNRVSKDYGFQEDKSIFIDKEL